jgi:hypothetical protein
MNSRRNRKRNHLSETRIDELVVSQAEDNRAWQSPVHVRRGKPGSFSIPADLAERAKFLAHLHRASGVQEWVSRVIRERVEIEEVAYAAAKREIKSKRRLRKRAQGTLRFRGARKTGQQVTAEK